MRRPWAGLDTHPLCARLMLAGVGAAFLGACAAASGAGGPAMLSSRLDLSQFVDVEVATVAIELDQGRPLALLHEDWQRILPVWIGNEEARAIARARDTDPFPRPLTHDLLTDVLDGLGGTLEEVLVYGLQDGIYYGLLRVRVDGDLREFDTRPSDGLALAVRTDARIRVDARLFEAGFDLDFMSIEGKRPIVRMRGITVSSASAGDRAAPGVLVLHTTGATNSRLLRRGDVILTVDGQAIDTPLSFVETVQRVPEESALNLTLVREGKQLEVRVPHREGAPLRS